jgi:site-specific DNA-methyltransferase (adenine-specific)
MTAQASFTLRSRNPDVLTCIANLSNDEVFTPPEFANLMLDTLTEAWANENNGANVWADKSVRFLDPCTKSGVFLREITSRLTKGLEDQIPDLQTRVNHILTNQVFGIGITRLTSLLARRSIYCSKDASNEHSIANTFKSSNGNIWFEQTEHKWAGERCVYCGAGRSTFERAVGLETHAYALIHADKPKTKIAEIFGGNMQFDVVVGNPPYQIDAEGNTRTMPIYQKFVDAAISLDPRYLLMITPSRWFAGGLGLDDFRKKMLADRRIKVLVDYPNAGDVFPGVSIEGGVSYFLWDSSHNGDAQTKTVRGDSSSEVLVRSLDEFDVLVRDSEALPILRKVLKSGDLSFAKLVSPQKPFGLLSNFSGYTEKKSSNDDYLFYGVSKGKRIEAWVQRSLVSMNVQLAKTPKVLLPEARGKAPDGVADLVLGRPWVVASNSVCTQTFMFVPVANQAEGKSVERYISTKFFRFLVSLRKISQHTKSDTYAWVPQQNWDKDWSDEALYKKYKLTSGEIAFIEKMIRPMNLEAEIPNE